MTVDALFVWELGGGLAHLAKGLLLADSLRDCGQRVAFVVRDLDRAHRMIPATYALHQAPLFLARLRGWPEPADYGEILLHLGFGEPEPLCARVRAWRSLFDLSGARLVIADHAPTALLAAGCADLPTLMVGNGFGIPPPDWPHVRVWERPAVERSRRVRALVLNNINECRTQNQRSAFAKPGDFLSASRAGLCTFRELDHYPARPEGVDYLGPIWLENEGDTIEWLGSGERRTFVYLRENLPGLEKVLDALHRAGCDATIFVATPKLGDFEKRWGRPGMRFTDRIVRLSEIAAEADAVVCSGTDTAHGMALAGVPVLQLPMNADQRLAAYRLRELGAGDFWVDGEAGQPPIEALISSLFTDRIRAAAASLARRHAGFTPARAVERLRDRALESLSAH